MTGDGVCYSVIRAYWPMSVSGDNNAVPLYLDNGPIVNRSRVAVFVVSVRFADNRNERTLVSLYSRRSYCLYWCTLYVSMKCIAVPLACMTSIPNY